MTRPTKKTTRRKGAGKKRAKAVDSKVEQKAEPSTLFEFYKIFPPDRPRHGYQTELCDPSCQRVSKINLQTTLATACAESYGKGDFIALEVGGASEGLAQGLALAYWLISVKPNKYGIPCRKAEQIAMSDEDHEHLNNLERVPVLVPISEEEENGAPEKEPGVLFKIDHEHGHSYRKDPMTDAIRAYKDSEEWRRLFSPDATQRRVCAGQMAAKYFDLMPDPQAGEGMKPTNYIRLRIAQGADRNEIINELTSRSGAFGLPLSKANTHWESVRRSDQIKRKKEREKEQKPAKAAKTKAKK